MNTFESLNNINWNTVSDDMHAQGYALIPNVIGADVCDEFINDYNKPGLYRKTVVMERYRFGLGEYKYFQYPLPDLIQNIRASMYPKLAVIANKWMQVLNISKTFPDSFDELQRLCHENNQVKPTVLILKYGKGGHNTLHQDLYGEIFFPIQLVIFLSEPELDYEGGEFVLIQQTPRAQSKAIVLKPRKGDILLFTTNFRPVKGTKGYYKVNMKHGVSEVHKGNRFTLGIIFHDALS